MFSFQIVDATLSFTEIMESMMYKPENFILNITKFQDPELGLWSKRKVIARNLMTSYFHVHYGHCYNLDFSDLSKKRDGMFLMKKGVAHLHLKMKLKSKLEDENLRTVIFLHNGTDVENIGGSILPVQGTFGAGQVICLLAINTNHKAKRCFLKHFRNNFSIIGLS